jgi:hypothetical protein
LVQKRNDEENQRLLRSFFISYYFDIYGFLRTLGMDFRVGVRVVTIWVMELG